MILGFKFIPSFFSDSLEFTSFLFNSFDENFSYFNNNLFYAKCKDLRSGELNRVSGSSTNTEASSVSELDSFLKEINQKYKGQRSNINFQKEALELRNKYFGSIENKEFKLEQNLSKKQIWCLKKFVYTKPFKLVNCDKNVGWAVLENSLYTELGIKYLTENSNFFKKLEYDPLKSTINSIN